LIPAPVSRLRGPGRSPATNLADDFFWRIQRLKRGFRKAGVPGSQMLRGVMCNGCVLIIQLTDDLPMQVAIGQAAR
jgi:hypothetical protein